MKLEEAIKHCEEVAILNENTCKAKPDSNLKKYKKCAEEHRQLAEWLKDYKRLLEQEPTTKNNLAVDCIDRAQAQTEIQINARRYSIAKEFGGAGQVEWSDYLISIKDALGILRNLPSVIPTTSWIPVSERLPDERDWYLGIFKEPDTGWVNPIPYICDYVGCETEATTKDYWILNGFTNEDEHIDYYFNLECVAWRPLPEPYQEEKE